MQVEITKMVYQHPWYVSSAPHLPNGRLGVVFISPTEKVAVGVELPQICYWPDAESSWPDASGRPDRCSRELPIGRCQRPVACHRTRPVAVSRAWNLSVLDRTLRSCVRSVAASVRSLRPVACLPSHRSSVRSRFQRPVQRPVASASSFLRDLAHGLVPIFMLGLCLTSWVFSCASKVLLEVLIIRSSCRLRPSHVLHPIGLQNKHLQIH